MFMNMYSDAPRKDDEIAMMAYPGKIANHILCAVALLLAVVLVYMNSLDNSFHYDDHTQIITNQSIRDISPVDIWQSCKKLRFVGFMSFAVNYKMSGIENLGGWHLFNMICHYLCSVLVYLLILVQPWHKIRNAVVPLAGALFFAVHPLAAEPVNYIQARLVLFYTAFSLAGFLFFLLIVQAKTMAARVFLSMGMLVVWALSSLSKEVGIAYLPLFVMCAFVADGSLSERLFLGFQKKWKLVIAGFLPVVCIAVLLSGLYSPVVVNILHRAQTTELSGTTMNPAVYLATQVTVFWRYASLLAMPLYSRLNFAHCANPFDISSAFAVLIFILSCLGLAVYFFVCFRLRRRHKLLSFCLLSIFAVFFPYMVVAGSQMMVEYKAYPAIAFFSIFLAAILDLSIAKRYVIYPVCILLVCFFAFNTFIRNMVWSDDVTLWRDAVQKAPQRIDSVRNLAFYYCRNGEYGLAIPLLATAVKAFPDYEEAYSDLARAYAETGDLVMAESVLKRLLSVSPRAFGGINNLGIIYMRQGKRSEATEQFKKAIDIQPEFAPAHSNLGVCYAMQGDYEKALPHFEKAAASRGTMEDYSNLKMCIEKMEQE
jgi:Flp pilus assembly protein TadD